MSDPNGTPTPPTPRRFGGYVLKGDEQIPLFILCFEGACCPKCGAHTVRTSTRWMRCPACGVCRIPRRFKGESMDEYKARWIAPEAEVQRAREAGKAEVMQP